VLRIDKRELNQLREIELIPNPLRFAEGSCEVRWGQNRILCAATLEPKVPGWMDGKGKGWVTAEYAMLPRSGKQRIQRDANKGKTNSRAVEIQRLIGRSLRAVVDLEAFGERMLTVDCDVIEADGGTRTASITGGFTALALAIDSLRKNQQVGQKAKILKDYLAAVSVGIVEGRPVLDLCYLEDSQAETDMNVVMTGAGKFVEIQGTAEGEAFSRDELDELLGLAKEGIDHLVAKQRELIDINAHLK